MIIAILDEISYVCDADRHSVSYAERATRAVVVPKIPSSHWMAVVGTDQEDVHTKLRAQVVKYLQLMSLNPDDFKFSYRHSR